MHNHEPQSYWCPFCRNISTGTSDKPLEVVFKDEDVFVKLNPKWWPRNPGAALVIPVQHFENVYAAIMMIGFIGLGVDLLLARFGRVLFPWDHTVKTA